LCCAAALGGCSILRPPLDLAALGEEPVRLAQVPFYPQTEYQCGPSSLAAILGASGVEATPEELRSQVYLPERRGSLQVELLGATRRAGRVPYVVEETPEALLAELRAGRPVLVLQNLRVPRFPVWHYAVLVGSDPARNRLLVHTGRRRERAERAPVFLRRWDWAGRWGLIALVPGELPARADPLRYAEAVAAFEPVGGPDAAAVAWRAAVERWPDDPRPRLALGNLAYAAGRRETALAFYREGLERDPGDAVLANNLASVLGELGCPRAGEAVARPVAASLDDDSPWRERLRATVAELADRKGADATSCERLASVRATEDRAGGAAAATHRQGPPLR
jgi:tetratricopeptide (TPR) repeat protein